LEKTPGLSYRKKILKLQAVFRLKIGANAGEFAAIPVFTAAATSGPARAAEL
jgi:hypothetical protein